MTPVFWFLGLSGSGKSTLARTTYDYLAQNNKLFPDAINWYVIDGDVIRKFLGSEIGYGYNDRRRSVKIAGLLAQALSQNNIGVIVANISPFRDLRIFMRENIPGYIEIYCKCRVEACIQRDPQGHYSRQFKQGVKDFVGLDLPFQEPDNPNLLLNTEVLTIEQCLNILKDYMQNIKLDDEGLR